MEIEACGTEVMLLDDTHVMVLVVRCRRVGWGKGWRGTLRQRRVRDRIELSNDT